MSKFAVLKNIFLVVLVVGVILMVTHYAEPVKNMALGMLNMQDETVLGASSERAQDITGKVGSDIADHFAVLQKQALEVTLGDIIETISRVQKIPQDISTAHDFIKEQADNVLQSGNKK